MVLDPDQPAGLPVYFMLIDWADGRLLKSAISAMPATPWTEPS